MKMLSKENLMARTSDIGSCLGLLAGKILIVGFVVASAYGSSGVDRDIDSKTGLGLKQYAQQLKNTAGQLQKRTEELQEQLSKRSASSTEVDVIATKENLDSALNEGGRFDSPLKKLNSRAKAKDTPGRGTLRREIVALQLTGNQAEDLAMVLQLFKRYADRKIATSDSTALVRRSGEPQPVTVDLSDILTALNYAAAGVFGQQMQSLCKQFYVPVSLVQQPKALTIDFDQIANKYIRKVKAALFPKGKIWQRIQPYQPEILDNDVLCQMIEITLHQTAGQFTISEKVEDIFDAKEELAAQLFKTTCSTFFNYMRGNANKKTSALFGRGDDIDVEDLRELHRELSNIFDSKSLPSFRVTHTQIDFGTERVRHLSADSPRIAMWGWEFPLLNTLIQNAMCPTGPHRPLPEIGDGSFDSSSSVQRIAEGAEEL